MTAAERVRALSGVERSAPMTPAERQRRRRASIYESSVPMTIEEAAEIQQAADDNGRPMTEEIRARLFGESAARMPRAGG